MQRRFVLLAGVCLVAFCFGQERLRNLIENGSLEGQISDDGLPKGWYRFAQPESGYRFSVVNGGHTGAKSLLIEGAGDFGGVTANRIELDRAKRYATRGWVKIEAEAGATGTVKFDYFAADGKHLLSTVADFVTPKSKDWQLVALTDRAADAPDAKLIGTTVALTGKGRAWFDDLEMVGREGAASSGNLIRNANMEDIVGVAPLGWWLGASEGGKAQILWSDEQPKDGWYCLRLKGNADWAVGVSEHVKLDRGKTYTLTGFVRARRGRALIKIDYFRNGQHIGQTDSEEVTTNEWQRRTVVARPEEFPNATHLAGVAVGLGEMDATYDSFTLTAK